MDKYQTALTLYQTQVGAMDQLWALFVAICAAAIGALSSGSLRNRAPEVGVVAALFFVFAAVNIYSTYSAQTLLRQLACMVNRVPGEFPEVFAHDPLHVCFFHGFISVSILVFAFLVGRCWKVVEGTRSSSIGTPNVPNR